MATLEPERLRDFYRTIDVGKKGYIWVMHPVWGVLFREPSPIASADAATANNPLVARLKDTAPSGFVRATVRARRAGVLQRVPAQSELRR